MFRLIGIIVFVAFLYVGFFGWEENNIDPFLKNLFEKEQVENVVEETSKLGEEVIKETDNFINN